MARTLVVGYGNPDRQDDGVAYVVINALRRRLGQASLNEEETGLDHLGQDGDTDSVCVMQLAPELLDAAAGYEQIVFVDAHVGVDRDDLNCTRVQAGYGSAAFTHHMTPAMFLALLQVLYNREPAGYSVSIRGHRFDFAPTRRELSPATRTLVEPAAQMIVQLATEPYIPADGGPRPAPAAKYASDDGGLSREAHLIAIQPGKEKGE
jgi:hydrogenase maturation protease